jgi:hypothetical protein
MLCKFCGTNNPDGATFCANCGSGLEASTTQYSYNEPTYSQQNYNQGQYSQNQYSNPYNQPDAYQNMYQNPYANYSVNPSNPGLGFAIAGMVCGIISLFCFAYILGTLGIIFGAVSKNKGCENGMATAGIVCGIIGIVLWVLFQIFSIGFLYI